MSSLAVISTSPGVRTLGSMIASSLRARLLDDRDQVLVVVRRVGAVDAHHHGLAAEVQRAERLDHPLASAVLLVRRDGVLEVEEDLVGLQPSALARKRSLDPGTAWHVRRDRGMSGGS